MYRRFKGNNYKEIIQVVYNPHGNNASVSASNPAMWIRFIPLCAFELTMVFWEANEVVDTWLS